MKATGLYNMAWMQWQWRNGWLVRCAGDALGSSAGFSVGWALVGALVGDGVKAVSGTSEAPVGEVVESGTMVFPTSQVDGSVEQPKQGR